LREPPEPKHPRSWAERASPKVIHSNRLPKGGHLRPGNSRSSFQKRFERVQTTALGRDAKPTRFLSGSCSLWRFREIGQGRGTALADFDCALQRRDHLSHPVSHQAIAFIALRAVIEYMSRVNPLTMRLTPTMVPMAQVELIGQGRQIT
jgi:hypothetical protein